MCDGTAARGLKSGGVMDKRDQAQVLIETVRTVLVSLVANYGWQWPSHRPVGRYLVLTGTGIVKPECELAPDDWILLWHPMREQKAAPTRSDLLEGLLLSARDYRGEGPCWCADTLSAVHSSRCLELQRLVQRA